MSNPEVLLIEPPSAEIAAAAAILWIGTSAANVRHISACGKCRTAGTVEVAT